MAIDVYSEVRKIISNFMLGIVSSIDDRDANETSVKNLVGFNLSEKRGKSTRDYGVSDYFADTPLPTRNVWVTDHFEQRVAVSQIFGLSTFRIQELGEEFVVLYGSTPYGLPFGATAPYRPAVWIRKYRGPSMIDGTGTVSVGAASRTVVGQGDTKFAEEIALGEYIGIGGITKKITRLLDVPFTESLYVLSAFGGAISDSPFLRQANSTVDAWMELTDVVLTSPTSINVKLQIATVTTTTVDEGTFTLYRILSIGNVYPDNYFAGWIIRDLDTLETYTIVGSANVIVGGFSYLEFSIYEPTTTLTTNTPVELYRYAESLKLNLPRLGALGDTWYSDNVSQDRLSFGWQWNAPRKEIPLMLDYVKRDFFYDGNVPLVKGRTDQIYFGREIPDYDSPADLGISYSVDFVAADVVYPSADLRKENWKNQANGTANLYQSIDESTFDPSDYVTTDIAKDSYRDFETQIADIGVGATGKLRVYVAVNLLFSSNGISAVSNTFSGIGPPTGTLSMGWKRGATGTISGSDVSTEVSGAGGSIFLTEFAVGDRIVRNSNGETRTVKKITANGTLYVDAPFSATFSGVAYSRITTIGQDQMFGYTSRYHYVEIDIATVDANFGGGVFASGTRTLTGRVEVSNQGKGFSTTPQAFTLRILQMKIEQPTSSPVSFIRFAMVPMFNGYMLGKPMLLNTAVNSGTPFNFYLRIAANFALLDKRLTSVLIFSDYGDSALTIDNFYSTWEVSLVKNEQNKRAIPWAEVNIWAQDSSDNLYYAQNAAVAENAPEAFVSNRTKTDLVKLVEILGYGIVKDIPSIGSNWRYQARSSTSANSSVIIDEDDSNLRFALYDSEGILNDHVFPNRSKDNASNPLRITLATRGELLGIVGQLERFYAFKRSAVEVVDAATTQSAVYMADVMGKKSIVPTSIGIVFGGKYGIYLFPIHGGLIETLTDPIRDEYVNTLDEHKEAMITVDCQDIGIILFSMPNICWMYHKDMRIWWKRSFQYMPLAMTKRFDNSVLIAGLYNTTNALVKYPDRSTYLDKGNRIPWVIETQWMTLGEDDIQKVIRTIESVTLSDGPMTYKMMVYFDRIGAPTDSLNDDGTPFDSMIVSTVAGLSEGPSPIKVPNSFREIKVILKWDSSLSAGNSNHPMDLIELKMFGETSVTGQED